MKKCIFFILFFFFCNTLLKAQTLTGYVFDKVLKEPVWNATVYLNGTSYNTITDIDGRFELHIGQEINTSLVVSYLKYEKIVIESPFQQLPDTIYLQERIERIDEIVIRGKAEKYSREKKLKAFRNQFLGTNVSGKNCQILNEDDIRIIYDSESRQLTATSNVPIVIKNNYLGYELTYDLKEFSVWYSDNSLGNSKMRRSYYLGTSFFKDTGENTPRIIQNRIKTYESSVNNFIRHLYEGTLDESGFTVEMNGQRLLLNDCFMIDHNTDTALIHLNQKLYPKEYNTTLNFKSVKEMLTVRQNNEDNPMVPFLDITYGNDYSQVFFYTDSFFVDHYHIISPIDKVAFAGSMGGQRVGNMLPVDYLLPIDYNSNHTAEFTQINSRLEKKVLTHFSDQLQAYPQEKIHLHTDRDYYVSGERIWFKAYLTDATTHQPSSLSRYVYVELINSSGTLVNRSLIRPENGLYQGSIFLSEMMSEGYYTLRAYTRYMDNPDADYFFKKHIRIGDISIKQQQTANENELSEKVDYDVSFFPEGGHLLCGVSCKIAFKALNETGISTAISGVIVDTDGNIQASLKTHHAGMGVFDFIPEKGKIYYADCIDANGNKKRFALPLAVGGTYSIAVTYDKDDQLVIERLKSADISVYSPAYILLQCRGQVLYFNQWDNSSTFMTFPKEEFPSGIVQIVLFDRQMNPLSERLVFCRNEKKTELEFTTDKKHYEIRDRVIADMELTDLDGLPLVGDFSVSVTDDKDQAVDHTVSILSTLLLTSELKGYIESPAYYLMNQSEESQQALDCLMLTHGWRRYHIPEVIKGKIEQPQKQVERSLAVTGKVVNQLTGRPLKNRPVNMMVMSTGEAFSTETAKDGRFIFTEFEFPNDTKFFLQSKKEKDHSLVELHVDEVYFPTPKFLADKQPIRIIQQATDTSGITNGTFIEKASERSKFDDEMRIVHLQDVEIIARKQNKDPEPFSVYSKIANFSIGQTELEEKKPATLLDVFNSIPGLTVIAREGPNDISLQFSGINNMYMSENSQQNTQPAIFINDVFMDPDMGSPLEMISSQDIERVDVFRPGSESGVYGLLGVYGVVNITTKTGTGIPQNKKNAFNQKTITPLGYQQPVEFYSPRYETQEQKFNIKPDLRTTIFWKPDIVTDVNGKTSFDFYTSDFSTHYSVVIEGITANGQIVHEVKQIVVK
ncbi:carboxypeptidase-like regulatory domain-containing protein [Parabacteroides sp. PF5-9]|uniref:carboxypeptidase-like regulatory domain-containing protein n=1 Tax=Parabacteroides sp. PF5-9 TaxID=1742404 RepID=UPI0024756901|nr:carboxypeptidase-like regulatory domain-containing protein [Parabacteroides sp. PF5-9]MDH6356578.1 hypothetical protein [Parabacteroides sp. PF5-9]